MRSSPSLVTEGIVLNKKKFSESSLICDMLSPAYGKIAILAKGARKAGSKSFGMLQTGAELETELHHKRGSDWYLLKKADMKTLYSSTNFETLSYMQAGMEIFSQMVIDEHEYLQYYQLLKNYLNYTANLKRNAPAIFWRLLLRIMDMHGIAINWKTCQNCSQKADSQLYYSFHDHGVICRDCRSKSMFSDYLSIDAEMLEILNLIPSIGNHINEIEIKKHTTLAVNKLLLSHLNYNFDQHFYLKSIRLG